MTRKLVAAAPSCIQVRPFSQGNSFPLDIPKRFIWQHTDEGDLVFDPFSGVGTTCKAAAMLQRRYLGAELNPEEAAIARKWLKLHTWKMPREVIEGVDVRQHFMLPTAYGDGGAIVGGVGGSDLPVLAAAALEE